MSPAQQLKKKTSKQKINVSFSPCVSCTATCGPFVQLRHRFVRHQNSRSSVRKMHRQPRLIVDGPSIFPQYLTTSRKCAHSPKVECISHRIGLNVADHLEKVPVKNERVVIWAR
jgi:hypothetical protein